MTFADILASLIHDMKNSLGMVINTLGEIAAQEGDGASDRRRLTLLQHEAKRLNNNLIELLTLYKIENERVAANIEQLNVADFLEELVVDNLAFAAARDVQLDWHCDPLEQGYFDEGLIRGVLNSLIGNGLRYTTDRLLVSAEQQGGYLLLRVEDNGPGFPPEMVDAPEQREVLGDQGEGRTRLGIYFAQMVAEMHRNRDRRGSIRIISRFLYPIRVPPSPR